MDAGRLGPVLSRHRVRNGMHALMGVAFFGGGVAIFVWLILLNASSPSALTPQDAEVDVDPGGNTVGYHPGHFGLGPLLLPFAMIFLALGAYELIRVLRWGPLPYIEVHEHGLVWGSLYRTRSRTWDQVRWLNLPARIGRTREQSSCLVVFDDGARLSYGQRTQGHRAVTDALREHCRGVASVPVEQRAGYRYRRVWLAVGAVPIAGMVPTLWYMISVGDNMSDGQVNLLSALLLMQLIICIVGFSAYATIRKQHR